MYFFLGADLRLPERSSKSAPWIPKPALVFDFEDSLRKVFYWWRTNDWPNGGSLREQAPKAKMVVQIMTLAQNDIEKKQALRMETVVRILSSI